MADTTTISGLTEKQTLVDTDKILVEDTNGVGQALLGSAITNKINGALANLMTKEEKIFSSVTEKLEFSISNEHLHIFYSSYYAGRGLFLFVLPRYNSLNITENYNDGFVVEDKTSGPNMKIAISLASWNTDIQKIVHIIL